MAFKISKGHMWRSEIEDKAGTFARSLKPFADAGQNLRIIAGWAQRGADEQKDSGSIEIFPVMDEKGKQCAQEAGLQEIKEVVCLIVEGEDRPGLAYEMSKAIADLHINLRFAMCQSIRQHFVACFGFQNDEEAEKAKVALAKL